MLRLNYRSTIARQLLSSGVSFGPLTSNYHQYSITTLKNEVSRRFSTCLTILKIKSDRINALRKQYDSFIEEDKKRKERNDLILQRLDKICYSTATASQLRPKTVYGEFTQPYNRFDSKPDKMKLYDDVYPRTNHPQTQPSLHLDIPRSFDDIAILREISKKYILIPKSQTVIFNNHMATNPMPRENTSVLPEPESNVIDNNNDWRSKYDILEQLKKKENEDTMNKPLKQEKISPKTQFCQPESDSQNNLNDIGIQQIKYDDMLAKYEAEIPEKDLPDDDFKTGNELQALNSLKISDNVPEEPFTNIAQPPSVIDSNINYNPVVKEPVVAESNLYNNPSLEQTLNVGADVDTFINNNNIPATENVYYQPPQEQINILYEENNAPEQQTDIGNNQTNEYQDYPNENEQHEPVVETTQFQENEYSPIPEQNPSETLQAVETAPDVDTNTVEENIEYPIDIINVQDFTPADNVELHDGVNINPEYIATNQEVNIKRDGEKPVPINEPNINPHVVLAENNADNSGIEAFDAEQKDMLYTYDQEGAGEPYDPEYVPDQEYQPNIDYNYYANEQQDAYPVQINEHEETSERYDRNYDQQFVTNYDGFDKMETMDQQQEPNQQYEQQPTEEYQPPAEYQQMEQGYEQYDYEQENYNTTTDVAQELDRENGFVEPNPEDLKVATETK